MKINLYYIDKIYEINLYHTSQADRLFYIRLSFHDIDPGLHESNKHYFENSITIVMLSRFALNELILPVFFLILKEHPLTHF